MHYGMTSLFRFRFCSRNQMSTSTKLDHMKNTVKHGNAYRYGFHRLSQPIVQNKSSISTRKVFLQRLDYVNEVAGGGTASHYCFDHASFSGLVFPTLRRVVSRTPTGPFISGRTMVLLLISDVLVL